MSSRQLPLISASHEPRRSLTTAVPSAQGAEVVTSRENDRSSRPDGATMRGASGEGERDGEEREGREREDRNESRETVEGEEEGGEGEGACNEGREHTGKSEGVLRIEGAAGDDLRARRRKRRAEKKASRAESTESTESTPRRVSEWRTRPLVPHGASQWPQIQSLAATSAGASLSIDTIFAALGLPPLADGHPLLPVRVRQHVNPLKTSLMAPPLPVDWSAVYEDPTLPLVVDIGSASGRLVLALAVRDWRWRAQQRGEEGEEGEDGDGPPSLSFLPSPPLNFLGFEIRDKLVQRADTWRRQLALRNAHFVVANATSALETVLATYPGPLVAVSILCPDPHFKNKHRKRRVVQRGLVEAIGRVLVPGGHVFVESDVEEVAADMYQQFAGCGRGGEDGGGVILEGGDESERGKSGREESESESGSEGVVESGTNSERLPRFILCDLVAAVGKSGEDEEGSVQQELASGERAGEGSAECGGECRGGNKMAGLQPPGDAE
ncbi:unnamed protein product [Closterium sp. Yama58-4]|nr:unnamed protein product [Closterium sp. Yama58-4]